MNTQRTVEADNKKKPEQLSLNLFETEKANIYVIVRSNKKGIEELVFASTDKDESINKLIDLRFKTNIKSLEDEDYSRIEDGFISDDYNIMVFKDNKFEKTSM